MKSLTPSLSVRLAVMSLLGVIVLTATAPSARAQATTNSVPLNRVPAAVLRALGDQDVLNSLAQPLMQRVLCAIACVLASGIVMRPSFNCRIPWNLGSASGGS